MTASLQPESRSTSRRALLIGALGGIGALAASVFGGAARTQAAAGSSLIIGSATNNAGTSNTILTTSSSVVAFELIQNGPGTALMGYVTPGTGGTRGVYGRSDSPNGDGVQARNAGAAGTGAAMRAFGGNNIGAAASSDTNSGVVGSSTSGWGVRGVSDSNTGVFGSSVSNTGVAGFSTTGLGVNGASSNSYGVLGTSGASHGVRGESSASIAVRGVSDSGWGMNGSSTSNTGVRGDSTSGYGVLGYSASNNGVYGFSTNGWGVVGYSDTSYAGYFNGPVYVLGLLTKAGGGFKVDHPLDPAGQYLSHSFVESPDMKNVYDGITTLNAEGEAAVELPIYFETLNSDLRYQLTPVGAFSPLYVKSKLTKRIFTISGGNPGQEVSWQVTGIRKDPWADAHRLVVEEPKQAEERGTYLHPELYGQGEEKGLGYRDRVLQAQPSG